MAGTGTGTSTRALLFALLALACGHMLSTLLRTIPAVSLDLMAADFATPPQRLATLTSIYHFAFAASQIPVGAAMDRFGVRPVSLSLLAGTILGAMASGFANGPEGFLFGQLMLGVATSGMLMCPMTLAAKELTPARFGLWSGMILSIGNIGMLLSSSPLAFVVERFGWRAGFWIAAAAGVVVAVAVFALVPKQPAAQQDESSALSQMGEVLRLGLSRPLRGLIALSLVSLAASLVLRGLWGGPWLMEVKGLSRIEAGNELGLFTLALIAGPVCIGMLDRRFGHRRTVLAGTHLLSAILLVLMALGAPHYPVSELFGVTVMPPQFDRVLFVVIGFAVSAQPLVYGMTRQLVDAQVCRQGAVGDQSGLLPRCGLDAIVDRNRRLALRIARGAVVHGRRSGRGNRAIFDLYVAGRGGKIALPSGLAGGGDRQASVIRRDRAMLLRSARIGLAMLAAAWLASAQQTADSALSEQEIRIGNIMPYTGPLAAFATIGKAQAAYFDMVNDLGGINGRKIKFISVDSNSDPRMAREQTHRLVEQEGVQLMVGSFGTPDNLATRGYLNEQKIPQLFMASGDSEWAQPKKYPWTMGWPPTFRAEGRIYANYIQAAYPDSRIAVIWENDQFGRDLIRGLQEGLGASAGMIVADITFDLSDTSLDRQLEVLKDTGADILVFDGAPAMAARAIRKVAEMNWHPVFLLDNASASIASALRPAGLQNAIGVISTAFLKDAGDPAWADDPAIKAWSASMDKYYPEGDKEESFAVFGYAVADTLAQVLKQCGDDLSRENIMRQAASLRVFANPLLLPDVVINTAPTDFRPIEQMRLVQFDGNTWQPIGDVVESAFSSQAGDGN